MNMSLARTNVPSATCGRHARSTSTRYSTIGALLKFRIGLVVGMAARAMGDVGVVINAANHTVLVWVDRFQVVRIDAGSISTEVVEVQPVRDRSELLFIKMPVSCHGRAVTDPHPSVSLREFRSVPNPAPRCGIDVVLHPTATDVAGKKSRVLPANDSVFAPAHLRDIRRPTTTALALSVVVRGISTLHDLIVPGYGCTIKEGRSHH
jgi:hypothetical protein